MSRKKLIEAFELMLNEEDSAADELLHNWFVQLGRSINEQLEEEDLDEESFDEAFETADYENDEFNDLDANQGEVDADMGGDDEFSDEFGGDEMGGDEMGGEEGGDMQSKLQDLSDDFAELQAELDAILGMDGDDGDMGYDDDMGDMGDDEIDMSDDDGMDDMGDEYSDDDEMMMAGKGNRFEGKNPFAKDDDDEDDDDEDDDEDDTQTESVDLSNVADPGNSEGKEAGAGGSVSINKTSVHRKSVGNLKDTDAKPNMAKGGEHTGYEKQGAPSDVYGGDGAVPDKGPTSNQYQSSKSVQKKEGDTITDGGHKQDREAGAGKSVNRNTKSIISKRVR